jgi:hypothetical protein
MSNNIKFSLSSQEYSLFRRNRYGIRNDYTLPEDQLSSCLSYNTDSEKIKELLLKVKDPNLYFIDILNKNPDINLNYLFSYLDDKRIDKLNLIERMLMSNREINRTFRDIKLLFDHYTKDHADEYKDVNDQLRKNLGGIISRMCKKITDNNPDNKLTIEDQFKIRDVIEDIIEGDFHISFFELGEINCYHANQIILILCQHGLDPRLCSSLKYNSLYNLMLQVYHAWDEEKKNIILTSTPLYIVLIDLVCDYSSI